MKAQKYEVVKAQDLQDQFGIEIENGWVLYTLDTSPNWISVETQDGVFLWDEFFESEELRNVLLNNYLLIKAIEKIKG